MNSSTETCWPFLLLLLGIFLGLVAFDYLVTVEDCLSTNNAGVVLVNIAPQASNHFFQPNAEIVASNVLFQASPPGYDKSYFMPCGKACHPVARALRELGWQKLNEPKNARLIHLDEYDKETESSLETYQRFNHLEDSVLLAESKEFWSIMKQYKKTNARGRSVSFLPNTYRMSVDHERRAFERLVTDGVAKLTPWIATIKKYSRKKIIPSHAKLLKRYQSSMMTSKQIMQKYICDQMIWNHRQFVVRVFWLVASVDPLIVLYQDGFVRIGYPSVNLLQVQGDDQVVDFGTFDSYLQSHVLQTRGSFRRRHYPRKIIEDPLTHVRNQMKDSIATIVDAFRDQVFHRPKRSQSEDGYEVFATDFIVDNDLNVWLQRVYTDHTNHASDVQEDYYFLYEKVHELWYGMILTLQEIWNKQAQGKKILPLVSTGKWEPIVTGDSWIYSYEGRQESSKQKYCQAHQNSKSFEKIVIPKFNKDEGVEGHEGSEDLTMMEVDEDFRQIPNDDE